MLKSILASVAAGALLAQGALAQEQAPAADPAAPTVAPGEPATELGAAPPAPAEVSGDWVIDEGWRPADIAAVTADQMIGADIRNPDGQVIASVDDLILGADGKAESIAATFGGFLGFGTDSVVLALDEVEFLQNDAGQVTLRTNLTPEALEGRAPPAG